MKKIIGFIVIVSVLGFLICSACAVISFVVHLIFMWEFNWWTIWDAIICAGTLVLALFVFAIMDIKKECKNKEENKQSNTNKASNSTISNNPKVSRFQERLAKATKERFETQLKDNNNANNN